MKKCILSLFMLALTSQAMAGLPFKDAVQLGPTLYISGQIGSVKPSDTPVPGGIKAETRQAMENIKTILIKHGVDFSKVAKCTVMLADIKEWAQMNEVYVTYFPNGQYPARSAFGASGLASNARLEIECIADLSR